MTNGEKMVWAVVFAKKFDLSNRPGYLTQSENYNRAVEEWEHDQTAGACEAAAGAVWRLRSILGRIERGFGEESDVYRMLFEMLKGEP